MGPGSRERQAATHTEKDIKSFFKHISFADGRSRISGQTNADEGYKSRRVQKLC